MWRFFAPPPDMTATLTIRESTIDGGSAQSFKNGDTVTVKRPSDGEVVRLEMTAENAQGVKTYERAEFTFREDYLLKEGDKLLFRKPDSWGDAYAYIYNADDDENSVWPGDQMTKGSDGEYSYTLENDFRSPLVIFNDGQEENGMQYPEAGAKGLKAEKDKTYQIKQ